DRPVRDQEPVVRLHSLKDDQLSRGAIRLLSGATIRFRSFQLVPITKTVEDVPARVERGVVRAGAPSIPLVKASGLIVSKLGLIRRKGALRRERGPRLPDQSARCDQLLTDGFQVGRFRQGDSDAFFERKRGGRAVLHARRSRAY